MNLIPTTLLDKSAVVNVGMKKCVWWAEKETPVFPRENRGDLILGIQIVKSSPDSGNNESRKGAVLSLDGFFNLIHNITWKSNCFINGRRCFRNLEFAHMITSQYVCLADILGQVLR